MLKLFRNLLISLVLFVAFGLLSPAFAAANTANPTGNTAAPDWMKSGYPESIKDCIVNNGVSSFCYVNHMDVGSMLSFVLNTMGAVRGVTIPLAETDEKYIAQINSGSAVAGFNNVLAFMVSNPPADLALWVRDTGETLGFLPRHVRAQGAGVGYGFTGLAPLLPLWRGFRNVAYVLVAIMLIVVGFMVMFRKRIDPKTVVTVQNSLPRIVVVLLLITFSYAIAGFLIDIMYLTIGIGVQLLKNSLPSTSGQVYNVSQNLDYINGGFLTLLIGVFAPIVSAPAQGLANIIGSIPGMLQNPIQNLPGLITLGATVATSPITFTVGAILWFVVAIAYLFAFIRILFMLLKAYVNLILAVLVAPLQIMLDALPGSNSFVSWLKNFFVNLIPFPITVFMLILGNALATNVGTSSLWTPPLLPQFGVASAFATTILWLGIVMAIPSIVNSITEATKAKAVMPTGVGAVVGPLGGGVAQVFQLGYQGAFITSMFRRHEPTPVGEQMAAHGGGVGGVVKTATGQEAKG